jgi:hypothetical protein
VDPTPAAITAVLAKHDGHISASSELLTRLLTISMMRPAQKTLDAQHPHSQILWPPRALLSAGLGVLLHALVHCGPTFIHSGLVLIRNETERRVPKRDQRSAGNFAQPILHIGNHRE